MEPVRFADILFTLFILSVTFGVLWMVNKVRTKDTAPENHTTSTDIPDNKNG